MSWVPPKGRSSSGLLGQQQHAQGNWAPGWGLGGGGEDQGHPGSEVLGFVKSHIELLEDKEVEYMLSHTAGMAAK